MGRGDIGEPRFLVRRTSRLLVLVVRAGGGAKNIRHQNLPTPSPAPPVILVHIDQNAAHAI